MNKLGTKLGAVAMSAVMALSFAPSAAITSLAAGDGLTDPIADSYQTVYVCYDANSGEHLWTTEKAEADWLVNEQGWLEGNPAWKAPSIAGEPVYRLYSPSTGEHHYTANKNEATWLEGLGWNNEKVAFLTPDPEDDGATPILCYRNPNGGRGAHQYTISEEEAEFLDGIGWGEEDPRFYGYELTFDPVVEELTVSIDNTTPKVGDTLTATVVDRNGEDVSENVTFQWYANDEAIEGATDETLVVTVAMVGSTIKVVATTESGNTFESEATAEVEAYVFEIESAEATAVDTIEVTFNAAQDTETTDIVLTKNGYDVDAVVDWDDEGLVATIKTTAKMTNGTYTVTATDAYDNEDSADVEIESQHVDEIVIKGTDALTNAAKTRAYAYYDVLDQYGESMRTSTSIQWSGSAAKVESDKSNGMLTFWKNAAGTETWTYSDQIYITGVHVKTGTTGQATLKVTSEQALDSIEIAGFVKKGSVDLIQSLPADFKTATYYMAYKVLDQNGNEMDITAGPAGFPVQGTDVTFISDNILLISEITETTKGTVETTSIDGETFALALVSPGIKVSDGGEVNITAIANKTGNKTTLNVAVGEGVILDSFELLSPSGIIADNEKIEIPFTALDTNGNEITNFVNLAKQKTFNTLSFSSSDGALILEEKNDGTAKLYYDDAAKAVTWAQDAATDGIDRAVNLTAIVAGGGTSNEMIYVQDLARPDAIYDVRLDNVFVEGAQLNSTAKSNAQSLNLNSFKFLDQYGRKMTDSTAVRAGNGTEDWGDDGGFFAGYNGFATSKGSSDFATYVFGVRATYSGQGWLANTATAAAGLTSGQEYILTNAAVTPVGDGTNVPAASQVNQDLWAQAGTESAKSGETLKFEIVKAKTDSADWEAVSTARTHTMTIVDIQQLVGYAITDPGKIYLGAFNDTAGTKAKTGAGLLDVTLVTAPEKLDMSTTIGAFTGGLSDATTPQYKKTIKVTATYNGSTVTVPAIYYTVAGKALAPATVAIADNTLAAINAGVIKLSDLYDATSAKLVSKDAKDTIVATVYDDNGRANLAAAAPAVNPLYLLDTAKLEVAMSDQASSEYEFKKLKDSYTVNPTQTGLAQSSVAGTAPAHVGGFLGTSSDDDSKDWYVVDQYGVAKASAGNITFRVTNVVENPDGYAENNFKVTGNATNAITIIGAERGDTFDVEVAFGSIKKTVSVTVGADANANITGQFNTWRDTLVNESTPGAGNLAGQRKAGLA